VSEGQGELYFDPLLGRLTLICYYPLNSNDCLLLIVLQFANGETILPPCLVLEISNSVKHVWSFLAREEPFKELPTKLILKDKNLARSIISY
jgi:hypothetical protein